MAEEMSLEALRREVDTIDDALHDLLMRRAAATDSIARTKPRTGGHIALTHAMRPAREAQIMRRLMARHQGALAPATVARIFREVLSASLRAQVPFRVHVYLGAPEFADLAREYFGAGTPFTRHETASRVLNACGEEPDSLGVVPAPDAGTDAWWARLAPAGAGGPRVMARLPCVAREGGAVAYAVAAIEQEPTGDDTTFLLAEVAPSMSRGRLQEHLKAAEIHIRGLTGGGSGGGERRAFAPMLLEAEGFFAAGDARLAAFLAAAGESAAVIVPVGGYANPVRISEGAAS